MKLTVKQLRKIIKEEVETAMAVNGGSLRNKYSDAFDACDENTRSGRAEKDWWFSENESPEEDGTTVLWAEPKVSGDSIWWDPNVGLWMEEDGSPVW